MNSGSSDTPTVEQVFEAAVSHLRSGRGELLDSLCVERPDVRREVEELLKAYDRSCETGGLGSPIDPRYTAEALDVPAIPPHSQLGAYRIIKLVGEGGFGLVYLVERERPFIDLPAMTDIWSTVSIQGYANQRYSGGTGGAAAAGGGVGGPGQGHQ